MSNITYLLFVGSGRTGSTLVGQLLNCHPNIMITNESRVLQDAIKSGVKISQYIPGLMNIAHQTMTNGTSQYDRHGKKEHTQKWQRDWVDVSKIANIDKGEIKFIGDKKQGGNTSLLIENESAVRSAIDTNFIPITVIRDPNQVLASYIRLNNDVKKSCDIVMRDMSAGHDFAIQNNGIVMRYENLLNDPRKWCNDICNRLGIAINDDWISLVTSTVNSDKKDYILSEQDRSYFESLPDYDSLVKKMDIFDF